MYTPGSTSESIFDPNSKNNANRVFNTNLVGTFNVLEKVKQDNAKIIFISTGRTYRRKKAR